MYEKSFGVRATFPVGCDKYSAASGDGAVSQQFFGFGQPLLSEVSHERFIRRAPELLGKLCA